MSDTELIIKLLQEQDDKRDLQIKGIQKSMDAGFDTIADADRKRNGRIEMLECETRVVRWFERNPIKTLIIAAVFVSAVIIAFVVVDFRGTLSKQGIELKK